MDLEPSKDEQAQSTAHRRDVLRQLRQGVGGYPAFQRTLADLISPQEAEEARRVASAALRALQVAIGLLFLMLPLRLAFETAVADAAVEIYVEINLIAILVLVGYFRIPYAGRLLAINDWLLTMVVDLGGLGLSRGNDFGYVPGGDLGGLFAYAVVGLPGVFLLGWLIDFAASTEVGRKWPLMRRLALAAFGALGPVFVVLDSYFPQDHYIDSALDGALNLLMGAIFILWASFAIPYLEHRNRAISEDALTVYHAAISRWMMHVAGKLLAIAVIAVTAFVWLRAIDTVEQMTPSGNSAEYVRLPTLLPNATVTWDMLVFWPRLARPLKISDFQQADRRIYALDPADVDTARALLVLAKRKSALDDTVMIDGPSYQLLSRLWDAHRVKSVAQYYREITDGDTQKLWVLERLPRHTLLAGDEEGAPRYFHLLEPLSEKLLRYREGELSAMAAAVVSWSIPTVLFGALAFVVLWRRGGDSVAARWTGLWLGGIAAWSVRMLQNQDLGTIDIPALALAAQDTTMGRFLIVVFFSFVFITLAVGFLYLGFIPQWALYAHVGASPLPMPSVVRARPWLPRHATLGLLALAAVVNYGLLFLVLFPNLTRLQSMVVLGMLNVGTMCAVWYRQGRRECAVSRNVVLAFISANLLVWLYAMPGRQAHMAYGILLNAIMSLLFVFWFARAVFQDDFLQLAGGRDISFLASVIVLPILFEASEGRVQAILERFGFFSETATGIIGTVAVVLLVQPVQRLLSAVFTRLANPGLSRVQQVVDQYAEAVADAGQASRDDPALQIFHALGITRFAFYACRKSGRLVELINNLDNNTPEIQISPALRSKLSATRSFIDLQGAAFEWQYFYEQFELYRLQRQLGCRYLFPVCVGHSLRAILCLGDGAPSRKIAREVYSEPINNLGIAKLSSAPASRPPS